LGPGKKTGRRKNKKNFGRMYKTTVFERGHAPFGGNLVGSPGSHISTQKGKPWGRGKMVNKCARSRKGQIREKMVVLIASKRAKAVARGGQKKALQTSKLRDWGGLRITVGGTIRKPKRQERKVRY